MKILLVALALFTLGAQAQIKAPTVYGKFNKIIRYIDQDAAGYNNFAGVEDGGRPTRFGFMGKLNTANTKVGYILEAGFNSESNGISIRRAVVNLDWGFGTFKIGQEWTAASLLFLDIDPLAHTGASLLGVPLQTADLAGGITMLGYYSRTRKDQIGYKSPEMMGFQVMVSYDRNDNQVRTGAFDNGLDAALTYKIDLGSIKTKAFVGYTTVHGNTSEKDDSMQGGASFTMGDLKVGGMYTVRSAEDNSSKETDTNMMTISASYKLGQNTFAITYGNNDKEAPSAANNQKINMTSLGYMYDVNKYVQLNAFASMFKAEGKDNNDATMIGVGTWLQF